MRSFFILMLLIIDGTASAADKQTQYPTDGEYCTWADLTSGSCQRGDHLMISGHIAVKFCDFDEPIASFPNGDGGVIVCTFTGKERVRDERALSTELFRKKKAEQLRKEAAKKRVLERIQQLEQGENK